MNMKVLVQFTSVAILLACISGASATASPTSAPSAPPAPVMLQINQYFENTTECLGTVTSAYAYQTGKCVTGGTVGGVSFYKTYTIDGTSVTSTSYEPGQIDCLGSPSSVITTENAFSCTAGTTGISVNGVYVPSYSWKYVIIAFDASSTATAAVRTSWESSTNCSGTTTGKLIWSDVSACTAQQSLNVHITYKTVGEVAYACYYDSSVCGGMPEKCIMVPVGACQLTSTGSSMTLYTSQLPTSNFDAPKVYLKSTYTDALCSDPFYRIWMPSDTCMGPMDVSPTMQACFKFSWIGSVQYQSTFIGSQCSGKPQSIVQHSALDNVGVCTMTPTSSTNEGYSSSKVEFVSTSEIPQAVGTQHAHTVHTFTSPDCTGNFTAKSYVADECIAKPASSTTTTQVCVTGTNETTTVVVTVDGEAPTSTTTTTGSVCDSSYTLPSTVGSSTFATFSKFITNGNFYYNSIGAGNCAGEPVYILSSAENGVMYGACTPSVSSSGAPGHHGGSSHRVICDTCSSNSPTGAPTSSTTCTDTTPAGLPPPFLGLSCPQLASAGGCSADGGHICQCSCPAVTTSAPTASAACTDTSPPNLPFPLSGYSCSQLASAGACGHDTGNLCQCSCATPTLNPTSLPTSYPSRTPTLDPTSFPSASPVTSGPTSAGETYAPSSTPTFTPTLHTAVIVAKVSLSDLTKADFDDTTNRVRVAFLSNIKAHLESVASAYGGNGIVDVAITSVAVYGDNGIAVQFTVFADGADATLLGEALNAYLEDTSADGFAGQLPANSGGKDVDTAILDTPAGQVTATAAAGDDVAVDLVLLFGIVGGVAILVLVVIVVILIIVVVAMSVAKKSSTASFDGAVLASVVDGNFQSDGKAGSLQSSLSSRDTLGLGNLTSTPVFDAGAAQSLEMAEVHDDGNLRGIARGNV